MPAITELLRNVSIFRDLDTGELARVAEVCREQSFNSGEYIFREGEAGNRLYLIVEGEVRISREVPGSGVEGLAFALATVVCVPAARLARTYLWGGKHQRECHDRRCEPSPREEWRAYLGKSL